MAPVYLKVPVLEVKVEILVKEPVEKVPLPVKVILSPLPVPAASV